MVGIAFLASLLLMIRNKIQVTKYYYQDLSFKKSCLSPDYFTRSIIRVTVDLILIWLFPYPSISSSFFVAHKAPPTAPKEYNFDQFFTLLSLAKIVFIFRLIPHMTAVKSN